MGVALHRVGFEVVGSVEVLVFAWEGPVEARKALPSVEWGSELVRVKKVPYPPDNSSPGCTVLFGLPMPPRRGLRGLQIELLQLSWTSAITVPPLGPDRGGSSCATIILIIPLLRI